MSWNKIGFLYLIKEVSSDPKMGHITTFGGNPLIAASALATLEEITSTSLIEETLEKEKLRAKSRDSVAIYWKSIRISNTDDYGLKC